MWKQIIVKPIPKKFNLINLSRNDLHPISITAVPLEIVETAFNQQLVNYLENQNIIPQTNLDLREISTLSSLTGGLYLLVLQTGYFYRLFGFH